MGVSTEMIFLHSVGAMKGDPWSSLCGVSKATVFHSQEESFGGSSNRPE